MRSVRAMKEADLAAVAAIEAASFSNPWSQQSFFAMLRQAHIQGYVVEELETIQGFAVFSFLYDEGELLNIAVAAGYRKQHIGTTLLAAGIQDAAGRGVSSLLLEVRANNLSAIGFYEAHQFQKIGIRKEFYEKPREHAVVMRRRIVPQQADSNSH